MNEKKKRSVSRSNSVQNYEEIFKALVGPHYVSS